MIIADWTPTSYMQGGLKVLSQRSGQLTSNEWLSLIQARVNMLTPHMGRFALNRLDLVVNRRHLGELPANELELKLMVTGDPGFNLRMEGIFGKRDCDSYASRGARPRDLDRYWGLTRACEWVTIVFRSEESEGEARLVEVEYKHFGDQYKEMLQYISADPKAVWEGLGEQIEFWDKRLKEDTHTLVQLSEIVRAEKMLVHWILLGSEASTDKK